MKIAILGFGKMGKAIAKLAKPNHDIVLKINRRNRDELTQIDIQKADVVIEFSRPEAAAANIRFALEAGIPIISGTTGWLSEKESIEELCRKKNGTFFYASNFSVGVNLFFDLNKKLAKLMSAFPQYKSSIQEIHHVHKLDAPSGTAITLAEGIINNHSNYDSWSLDGKSEDGDIEIESLREGEVPGTHCIDYISKVDKISITHEAFTRDSFALGALFAAQWAIDKKGILTMEDLMKDIL